MIKIWIKGGLPLNAISYCLKLLLGLHEDASMANELEELFKINKLEYTYDRDFDEYTVTSRYPEWWYMGAFYLKDLQVLIDRDVKWKAESL